MKKQDTVNKAIESLLELFRSGNVPEKIADVLNPCFEIPSADWSLRNKLIMAMAGTEDARGFLQWKKSGRYIKGGCKAFYILAPCVKKMEKENSEGLKEEVNVLRGFRGMPVFRLEDTDGKEIEYKSLPVPGYRFIEVAESWGINVFSVGGNKSYLGAFVRTWGGEKKINMATPEQGVFYHELAHAGHDKVKLLDKRNKKEKEIVAEFCASVLSFMDGYERRLGNSYEYLKHYAGEENVEGAVMRLLGDIEKVLKVILEENEKINKELGEEKFINSVMLQSIDGGRINYEE
jgi:hypothetical protein